MSEPDFESILNAFTFPICVAKPILKNGSTNDFELVYFNKAFEAQVDTTFTNCRYFSEIKKNLPSDIPWTDMCDQTLSGIILPPVSYFSKCSNAWFKVQMRKSANNLIVINLENISYEKEQDRILKEAAYHDNLTNLPNRNKFIEDIRIFSNEANFNSKKMGLLLIDIDNMKFINDSRGTFAGDELLKNTAQILSRFNKEKIQSYRYGDDEFMVIIKNTSSTDSIINISDTIFEAFLNEDISTSGGITFYPDHAVDSEDLIRFSDIAMHCSKKDGKRRFTIFEPDMQRVFIQKLNIQSKMSSALEKQEFKLFYQPQFDIQSGNLRGFEALIRWHEKDLGDIGPSIFIPLAEENGLIIEIGKWIIQKAFETQKKWQTKYNFTGVISVNISPIQLKQPDFIDFIEALIFSNKLDPNTIEIEITEGIMIDNMQDAVYKMKTLKEMGFRLSLDDFGTGYSSLSYLQSLPFDTLKIDKSFINDITSKDGIQANITNSIISMVSNMGLDTIAEGVEHPEQLNLLKKFNCHIVQGFLRGKPMPQENCERYLAGDSSALLSIENQQ